jgi:hypothetical protein
MNAAIKQLEEIGQSTSLKEYENLSEMLGSIKLNKEMFNLKKQEFVCLLVPEDDTEDGEDDDDSDSDNN